MQVQSLTERRKVATARRRRMSGVRVLELPAVGDGSHGGEVGPYPEELKLECTHENGQLCEWFDDHWWLEALKRWKDVSLAIHIQPTPDALLHPVVSHELEMIKRMRCPWRLIGHCYLSDVAHPLLIQRVAVNHYDEIRIVDRNREASSAYEAKLAPLTLNEVFEQVRQIQSVEKVSAPLLTCAPLPVG